MIFMLLVAIYHPNLTPMVQLGLAMVTLCCVLIEIIRLPGEIGK